MPIKKGAPRNINHKKPSSKEIEKGLDIKLLTSALNATRKAVVITDSEGTIQWVNNLFSEITQYKLEEIIGKNPRILKSGIQDSFFYKDMWDNIKSGKTWEGRLFNKRKDGSIYLDEQVIYPFRNGKNGISHFICVKSDISNQAYTNEKILAQDHLLNILSDAVITADEKLNITGTNKGAEIIFEIHKADLLGQNAIELIADGLPKSRKNNIIKSLLKTGNYRFDGLITTRSALKKMIEVTVSVLKDNTNEITGYIFLIRDIKNQHLEFLKTITNNKYFLNSIYDSISQPILIFDKKYRIVASNRLFLERLKLQPTQFYQKKIGEVFSLPDEDIKRTEDRLLDVFENKKFRRFIDKYENLSNPKIIEAIYFPVGNDNGQADFVGLLYKDITEEKSAEKENIESEKLEDIGKMTTYILHQMKTPLNAIKMNIDMMGIYEGKKDTREKSYQLIQKEVNRLSRMIKEVMQYSHTDNNKSSKIIIRNIVEDIKNILYPILKGKSITLLNKIEDREIYCDNDGIITVFYHLIENSIEAINNKGKIRLTSSYNEKEELFSVFIEDTGCGIMDSDKIFEPFFTSKTNGTGLGLPIIKNILTRNDSDIKLINGTPGKTIFELYFHCVI